MGRDHLILSVSLNATGHHPGAWRAPKAQRSQALSGSHFSGLAKLAERGGLDMVVLGYPPRGSELVPPESAQAIRLDALSLAAALIPETSAIGLAAVAPATYWEPFNIARSFSALDNLSRGRAAWCVDAAWRDHDIGNFSRLSGIDPARLQERTGEFLDIVYALWDSWEPGSLVFDKAGALFTDPAMVHRIDHAGAFFTVEGPLNSPRPAQDRPVIIECDLSATGLARAAAAADVVLIQPRSFAAAADQTGAIKAAAAAHGRDLIVLADIVPVLDHAGELGAVRLAALDALAPPAAIDDPGPLAFAGAAADFADLMRTWAESGACDGFNLLPATFPGDLEAIVDGLVPELRRRGLFLRDYAGATLRDHLATPAPVSRHANADHG